MPKSGIAAVIGAVLLIATPWARTAVLGTSPYVTSVFDVGALADRLNDSG